jgi:hypothetical protein
VHGRYLSRLSPYEILWHFKYFLPWPNQPVSITQYLTLSCVRDESSAQGTFLVTRQKWRRTLTAHSLQFFNNSNFYCLFHMNLVKFVIGCCLSFHSISQHSSWFSTIVKYAIPENCMYPLKLTLIRYSILGFVNLGS